MTIAERARQARKASLTLAALDGETKNRALRALAEELKKHKDDIIAANREDYSRSEGENVPGPLLKRLTFGEEKIHQVIDGILSLVDLDEPVGRTQLSTELDEDLELYRVSCPIGVVGIIFESRPDALVQISSLCLKSGNAVLLKGGSEAALSNRILADIIHRATVKAGLPQGWIQLVETRADVNEMFTLSDSIDLLIPRGSNEFVQYIMEHSSIPVLGHSDGICHIYIHEDADPLKVMPVLIDSKTQYVAACNTVETLLVHQEAVSLLPAIKTALDALDVELCGCERTQREISVPLAAPEDWSTEYVDYKLSIKVVDSLEEAVDHINTYGSSHTDSIMTEDKALAGRFMSLVDASTVLWNCSTRFSDGFRFGFGAEIGISTSKIHARGPVGLEGLMIYKYKVLGSGQTAKMYAEKERTFKHAPLDKDCPL